jgi:hypothetical protein
MSLASGIIKLAPVKMGDLATGAATSGATSAATGGATKQAYLVPHLRAAGAKNEQPQDGSTKADATSFPSLGAKPKPNLRCNVWQKVTPVATPVAPPVAPPVASLVPKYKATVDACLEKERLTEAERNKQPETDFNKMTAEEKQAAGWATLALNRAAVTAFLEKLEEKEFPECTGTFTFAEMYALCSNYEKRADKEMNVYRPKGRV